MALTDKEYNPEPVVDETGTKHEANVLEIGDPSTWKRVSKEYCQQGQHNLVPDPSEREFEAVKCTNCPYGALVKRRVGTH